MLTIAAANHDDVLVLGAFGCGAFRLPPEAVGEVLGDLNMRRGTVLDMTQRDDMQIVHARVPMAQMFGYATAIRSLTKGRASYSMEPSDFALVSKAVHDHLLSL